MQGRGNSSWGTSKTNGLTPGWLRHVGVQKAAPYPLPKNQDKPPPRNQREPTRREKPDVLEAQIVPDSFVNSVRKFIEPLAEGYSPCSCHRPLPRDARLSRDPPPAAWAAERRDTREACRRWRFWRAAVKREAAEERHWRRDVTY